MAMQIGFFLKLFNIITIGAAINFPIDVARIIAGGVLAIFRKLDAEAFERTAMQAAEKALNHRAGAELHAGNSRKNFGVEKAELGVHIYLA
ncbi:MAG: hypothetical protein ALAOOOJD_02907 [bacterium]|nr:hypothetical protein [bacterium]